MSETTTTKPKRTRVRKPIKYGLYYVTETANETDAKGTEIPGTARVCLVQMPLPPGVNPNATREQIEAAVRKAVYDEGLEEYGNKRLRVDAFTHEFDMPFEKETVTRLVPKTAAEKAAEKQKK